ncbi:conserved Plasmodium protein, unknown function [Plasmodium sp. gorilla clade G2]|uniref:conserved Plasmodium protein, unknown function n=1 Tax=Plasmodium sp. gorilla clade G2 TaxID=880535 RepID=UPI000D2177D6|nr:conserved Plasmodium protein, unknown function [Plasmodium sp. gorilla clade G2]SOV17780.1 conserved Plasmodium protein, unknown function [Plasmodium sp. gorilla clade G2]
MEDELINKVKNISLNKENKNVYDEKRSLKKKIRDLENMINTKIMDLQTELYKSKEKEKVNDYDFSDILKEFKDDVKKKMDEINDMIEKKIEEQNVKHTKLFNMLISLKNENSSINKSISLLNEKIHMIQEDIGD